MGGMPFDEDNEGDMTPDRADAWVSQLKPVAVFGCGDSQGYGDNFCDAIEEMHSTFKAAGAKMLGAVDASGYSHSESKSEQDGKFLGLPLDQDNEDDQTEGRVSDWISQLKSEGMPL